jgi:flagellar hook-length control protein FliK
MSRVENLPSAAARTLASAQSREAASRPERTTFSLPEMLNQAAARQVRRPANESVPGTRAAQTRAAPERPQPPQAPERPRDQREAQRSRPADRAAEARERRDSRRAEDDRRADEPTASVTHGDRRATDTGQASHAASDTASETKDAAGAEEAATAEAGNAASEAAAAGPGAAATIAIALAVPGAPVPGASLEGAAAAAGKGEVPGLRGSGQGSGTSAKAGQGSAEKGHAAGETERQPAIPVAAVPGRQDGAEGEGGGAADTALPGLIEQLKDGAAGQARGAGRPAFGDLLDQAAGADPKGGATAQRAVVTDVAVGRVPIEIGLKALEGSNQFEIRLAPDELGRVDVKLDIDDAGQVKAHLVVERPEALALLTRDRSQLEQALEQAGLRPADGGISFSLRDGSTDGGGRFMQGGDGRPQGGRAGPDGTEEAALQGAASILPRAILSRLGALDLRI